MKKIQTVILVILWCTCAKSQDNLDLDLDFDSNYLDFSFEKKLVKIGGSGEDNYNKPGYTRYAGGINYGQITSGTNYGGKTWKGLHIRKNYFEIGYLNGDLSRNDSSFYGRQFYVGANFPLMKLKLGSRYCGVKGIMFVPFIATNLGILRLNGNKTYTASIAPGFSLQLPYTLIDFRLNTLIPLYSNNRTEISKLIFMPTITFQLDALWDAMDPILKYDGGLPAAYTYDNIHWGTHYDASSNSYQSGYWGENEREVFGAINFYKYQVGSHITLGPRYNYFNLDKKHANGGNLTMIGLIQSGRHQNFGYDAIFETGNIALADTFLNQSIKSTRALGRICVNILYSKEKYTQFSRLMAGFGFGHHWISKPKIEEEFKNSGFVNFFIGIELGAIGISYEKDKFFNESFNDIRYLSFTYRAPIVRLYKKYKATNNLKE